MFDIHSLAAHEAGHAILAAAFGLLPERVTLSKFDGGWVSLTPWPKIHRAEGDQIDAPLYMALYLAGPLCDPQERELHIEDRHTAEALCHWATGGFHHQYDWLMGEVVARTRKVLDERREYLNKVRDALVHPGGPHASPIEAAEAMLESPHILERGEVRTLLKGAPEVNLTDFNLHALRTYLEMKQRRELARKRKKTSRKRAQSTERGV